MSHTPPVKARFMIPALTCHTLQHRKVPKANAPRFGTVVMRSTNATGKVIANDSFLFRDRETLNVLVSLLAKNPPKAKYIIQCFGASYGYDPVSLAILLETKNLAHKTQIIASDLTPKRLKNISNGYLRLDNHEVEALENILGNRLHEYFNPTDFEEALVKRLPGDHATCELLGMIFDCDHLNNVVSQGYKLSDSLRKMLQLERKPVNILQAAKQPFPQNSVVLFRNAWFFLSPQDQTNLARDLFRNMPDGSYLVLGKRDFDKPFPNGKPNQLEDILRRAGFKSVFTDTTSVYLSAKTLWIRPQLPGGFISSLKNFIKSHVGTPSTFA